jgi:hypothetical protein
MLGKATRCIITSLFIPNLNFFSHGSERYIIFSIFLINFCAYPKQVIQIYFESEIIFQIISDFFLQKMKSHLIPS